MSTLWNEDPFPGATLNIVAHGDSMTLGGAKQPFISRLADLIEANTADVAQWWRLGIGGASWDYAWPDAGYAYTMTEDALLRVDPAKSGNLALTNWLIVFAGSNGIYLNDHSAATEYAGFKTYIAARIAAGWDAAHIIVCTMLPRSPGIHGDRESRRTTYNASLVGDDGGYGYLLARFDLDPNMGSYGDQDDTDYYQDGVHPTDLGHASLAQIIYDVMYP